MIGAFDASVCAVDSSTRLTHIQLRNSNTRNRTFLERCNSVITAIQCIYKSTQNIPGKMQVVTTEAPTTVQASRTRGSKRLLLTLGYNFAQRRRETFKKGVKG